VALFFSSPLLQIFTLAHRFYLHSGDYYAATGLFVIKVLFPQQTILWKVEMNATMVAIGGVTVQGQHVFIMAARGASGVVLDKENGTIARQLELQFPNEDDHQLEGTLFAGDGKLFYGDAETRVMCVPIAINQQ